MTDKAAVELNAPVTGKIVSLAGEPGDIVAVGAPLIVFETDDAVATANDARPEPEPEAAPEPAKAAAAEPAPKVAPAANGHDAERMKIITSPAIRRRAKEAGIDLGEVAGTGAGGRILRSDFDRFVNERSGISMPAPFIPPTPRGTEEIKVIGLRRMIAERMTEANREVPHFSYVEEVDITELESLRRHLNEQAEDKDQRMTLLPFLGLALIRTLETFPQCNSTYDKERNVILRHGAVHLGIATQTPDGLKVPVVKDAHARNLQQLSAEIRRVADAARNNSAKRDELGGSTITITSLGKLGGIASTPVINLPEVAIIGVNRAVDRPVVIDGQIAVRKMMNLSSSFDHRFVDGYDAAAMIQSIKNMLEHPATIFIS